MRSRRLVSCRPPGHFRLSVQHLWARYIKVSVVVGRAGGEVLRLESIWRLSSLRTRSSERPRAQTYVLMHMIIEELKSPLGRRLHQRKAFKVASRHFLDGSHTTETPRRRPSTFPETNGGCSSQVATILPLGAIAGWGSPSAIARE